MFENLLDLVKQHAGDAIINNPAIPNERNDEAIQATSSSIIDTLKNAVSGGNIGDIMHLFNSGGDVSNNPVAQNVQGGVIENLMHRFGLDQGQASGIASNLIPNVLQNLVHKTNDPNDSSFDIQSIISNIGGGGLDVNSLISKFTGGGGASGVGGGGIMDSLKGLFGN